MIAELMDREDFYDFLAGSGVPLKQDWTPTQCSQATLAWLVEQNEVVRTQFEMTVNEMRVNTQIMPRDVQEALLILVQE